MIRRPGKRRGASLTGYGMVVGMIAVGALLGVSQSGRNVTNLMETAANRVAQLSAPDRSESPGSKTFNGKTCKSIKSTHPGATDGTYEIDPDGPGGVAPFEVECDMSQEGGGWTVLTWDDTYHGDDSIIARSRRRSNGLLQCKEDQTHFFRDLSVSDPGSNVDDPNYWDHDNNGGTTQTYNLTWRNPATDSAFTSAQMAALRDNITELAPTTRMHAVKCDCDFEDNGALDNDWGDEHDARITDADGNRLVVTIGECGDRNRSSNASYHLMSTDAGSTKGLNGLNNNGDGFRISAPVLAPEFILPTSVDLYVGSGGGVMWGYERQRVRVR